MAYSSYAMGGLAHAVFTLTADKRNNTTGAPHYLNSAMRAIVRAIEAETGVVHPALRNADCFVGRVALPSKPAPRKLIPARPASQSEWEG